MGNGLLPNVTSSVAKNIKKKHLLIKLPGENYNRKCITKTSLMYVAYALNREFVHLPGLNDGAIRVASLSNDVLRAEVYMYHIDTDKTFTAIIAGSGFIPWSCTKKKEKK